MCFPCLITEYAFKASVWHQHKSAALLKSLKTLHSINSTQQCRIHYMLRKTANILSFWFGIEYLIIAMILQIYPSTESKKEVWLKKKVQSLLNRDAGRKQALSWAKITTQLSTNTPESELFYYMKKKNTRLQVVK